MTRKLSFLTALLLGAAGAAAAAELPRGTVVEKVVCAGQPDQAYALYLPSMFRRPNARRRPWRPRRPVSGSCASAKHGTGEILADAPGILARANPGNEPVTVVQIAAALKIPELKKRAESADVEESLAAKRILNTYLGQFTFYQPQAFVARQQWDRAIFMISLGAEIRPEDPGLWVEMASLHARKGKSGHKKALECLRAAVDKRVFRSEGSGKRASLRGTPGGGGVPRDRDANGGAERRLIGEAPAAGQRTAKGAGCSYLQRAGGASQARG